MSPDSLRRTTLLGREDKEAVAAFLVGLSGLDPSSLVGTSVSQWTGAAGLGPGAAAVVSALVHLTTYACDLDTFAADAAADQLRRAVGEWCTSACSARWLPGT